MGDHTMTPDERAAVAREVLTPFLAELTEWPEAHAFGKRYMQRHFPATAAPETVTVGGLTWTLSRDGYWTCNSGEVVSHAMRAHEFLRRIAADARALAERDKRIRELEAYKALADELGTATADMMRHLADGRAFDAPGRAHAREYAPEALARYDAVARRIAELELERDEARRALEAAQSAGNTHPSHQTPMNAALGHLAATGASEGPQRAGIAGAATVAPECRDMATATSQGEGLGAPTPKSEATAAVADDEIVSGAPSPAPIPLGAVLRVPDDPDSPYERVIGGWIRANASVALRVQNLAHVYRDDDNSWGMMLTLYYRATHADAATFERVAMAIAREAGFVWSETNLLIDTQQIRSFARAALRALGIQEVGQ